MSPTSTAVVAALVLGLAPTLADAGQVHRRHVAQHKGHHRHYARAPRYDEAPGYGYGPGYAYGPASEDPYSPDAAPGAAIRAQARINQNAPGVTNELAPGNIATATGGPSGGVPGFSGR